MLSTVFLTSQIGTIGWTSQNGFLTRLEYLHGHPADISPTTALDKRISQQISDYFAGTLYQFDLPLDVQGTAFQQRVWQALCNIPYGETRSYGELASELNTSARAIGNACRANPIPLIIPCHRITAQHGLGGFSGQTQGEMLDIKKFLLGHEQAHRI
ncbi:MAG: hypothetical protein CMF50_06225 [Legionellales bacterium]|nr:hypothetical protein [Legionellales bacterium]|tara:strand:- start:1468 stop:1938 length:471 start_codon:yes stop_codon:yes gene_type:complete